MLFDIKKPSFNPSKFEQTDRLFYNDQCNGSKMYLSEEIDPDSESIAEDHLSTAKEINIRKENKSTQTLFEATRNLEQKTSRSGLLRDSNRSHENTRSKNRNV